MKPPKTINVLDQHRGFTAITRSPMHVKIVLGARGEREAMVEDYNPTLTVPFLRWIKVWRENGTLWRPGSLLKDPVGILQEYNERSFYQTNNDVTKAIYKVSGYGYRIAVWFDNKTGKRIA